MHFQTLEENRIVSPGRGYSCVYDGNKVYVVWVQSLINKFSEIRVARLIN